MLPKSCLLCHRESECKNLKTLLLLMTNAEEQNLPGNLVEDIEKFRQCLKELEYKYPFGNQTCSLVSDKEATRDLVNYGTDLLRRVSRAVIDRSTG